MLSSQQKVQESRYSFPYHHTIEYSGNGIALFRRWSWALSYLGRIELVITSLRLLDFDSLLDVGCGDGKLIQILSGIYGHKKFCGIDYSEIAIKWAKLFCTSPNVEFITADIISGFKENGYYDVLTLIDVIEHIPPDELDCFLSAVMKHLKSKGVLICTVPSVNLPVSRKHYQHFSPESLSGYLKNAGFRIVQIEMIDGNTKPFKLITNLCFSKYWVIGPALQNALFGLYKRWYLRNQGIKGNGIFCIAECMK
jgi:2-polyprenyl-3-methyl-5-hydroxy-6-metoxy-1,4-benzoquinol methylase